MAIGPRQIGNGMLDIRSALDNYDPYDGNPRPEDCGLIAWTADPRYVTSSTTMSQNILHLNTIRVRPGTIYNVVYGIATAGTAVTTALIGLYDYNGNLLGQCADQSTNWASTGRFFAPLNAAVVIDTPQKLYVGVNGTFTTSASIMRGTGNPIQFGGQQAAPYWVGDINPATGLPASFNPRNMQQGLQTYWWGLC